MDRILASSAEDRATLEEHKSKKRRIRLALISYIKAVKPTNKMTFEGIRPRLKYQKKFRIGSISIFQHQFGQLLPTVIALGGLAIAVFGLLDSFDPSMNEVNVSIPSSFKQALACLLFTIPIFNIDNKFLKPFVVFILWLGTVTIGLYQIYLVREIFVRIYNLLGTTSGIELLIRTWSVFFLGAIWLIFVMSTGEYHYKNYGKPGSKKLLRWTVVTQLAILLIPLII
jgi:hypothetical protein